MKPTKKSTQNLDNNTKIENNLNIHIIPDTYKSLVELSKIDPEIGKKALEILEYDIQQSHKEKQTILELEKEEQIKRHNEIPFIRKYSFLGQTFAFGIGLAGLGTSMYFGYISMEKAAIASITTTLGVLALNFISKK